MDMRIPNSIVKLLTVISDSQLAFCIRAIIDLHEGIIPQETADGSCRLIIDAYRDVIDRMTERHRQRSLINRLNGAKGGRPRKGPVKEELLVTDPEPVKEEPVMMDPEPVMMDPEPVIPDFLPEVAQPEEPPQTEDTQEPQPKTVSIRQVRRLVIHDNPPLEQVRYEDESYIRFLEWLHENTPDLVKYYPYMKEKEFRKLKEKFGSRLIMEVAGNLDNRRDKKFEYTNIYRTLNNWCKRELQNRSNLTGRNNFDEDDTYSESI